MSISASAMTLADYALQSNDSVVAAISNSLVDNGAVAQDIPFVDKKSLKISGVRWEGSLPSVNWHRLNEEGDAVKGTPTPYEEQAFIMRNTIDVDHTLVDEVNKIVDPRSAQLEAYLKAQAYDFNDKFINNDHVTGDALAPVGIRYRIGNGTKYGVRSENDLDAGALDLTTAATTATKANVLLEIMEQALQYVDSPGGDNVVIYVNETMKRRLNFLARTMGTSGGFSQSKDQFDRTIDMYKGAKIRDIGRKADQSTYIITNTETSAGVAGSDHYTSMYFAHMGAGTHFFGWQYAPPTATNLGLINNGVIYRTFVEWVAGVTNASTRSLARIHGLKITS